MRRGCHDDTSEISADYAWSKSGVNVSHSPRRPSRKCLRIARRAGAVKARSRAPMSSRSVRQHRGLDGAEHRAILSYVMAEPNTRNHRASCALSHRFLDVFIATPGGQTRAADTTA